MNRKQKMIYSMWKNCKHNCLMQGENPPYEYKVFRNAYMVEDFNCIYTMKNWYRDIRI